MKRQGYHSARAEHDDLEYVFSYKPQADYELRTITIRSGPNLLFTLRSNEGFLSFFNEAEKYDPEWKAFPGSTFDGPDVIPADDDSSTSSEDLSVTADTMREPSDSQTNGKLREPFSSPQEGVIDINQPPVLMEPSSRPNVIPFDETDVDPIKDSPIDTEFTLEGSNEPYDSAQTEAHKRNQQRLMTIHERLGHMSFSRLQLLAKAGLIAPELANVGILTCPGCAYGKAHRRQWRHTGIKL
jgi:hypothetical protein